METLQFSQAELKALLGLFNHGFKSGNLSLGDVLLLAPIAVKIQEKVAIETSSEEPIEPEVIEPKN